MHPDSTFVYRNSWNTDIRETFNRIRSGEPPVKAVKPEHPDYERVRLVVSRWK
jgi:hypothetical protein